MDKCPILLVDTVGELGAWWGTATIGFVGGSLFSSRGGQNMIEPAAYGAAVVFGPHTWNFKDVVRRLIDADAAIARYMAQRSSEAVGDGGGMPPARPGGGQLGRPGFGRRGR